MEHKYWGVLRSVIPPLGVEGVEAGDCCLDQQARPQRPQWLVDDDTYPVGNRPLGQQVSDRGTSAFDLNTEVALAKAL
jgi:hypothetical protein